MASSIRQASALATQLTQPCPRLPMYPNRHPTGSLYRLIRSLTQYSINGSAINHETRHSLHRCRAHTCCPNPPWLTHRHRIIVAAWLPHLLHLFPIRTSNNTIPHHHVFGAPPPDAGLFLPGRMEMGADGQMRTSCVLCTTYTRDLEKCVLHPVQESGKRYGCGSDLGAQRVVALPCDAYWAAQSTPTRCCFLGRRWDHTAQHHRLGRWLQ